MCLDQEYIKSLNIPSLKINFFENNFKIAFKTGNILTNSYLAMAKHIPSRDGLYVLAHSQTLFTFAFVKDNDLFLVGPELINYNQESAHINLDSKIIYLSKSLNTTILEIKQCYQQILFFAKLIHLPNIDNHYVDNAFANAITSYELDDISTPLDFNDSGAHISYVYEQALKTAVTMGDPAAVHSALTSLLKSGRIGYLAEGSDLRNIKNWGIICVSVTLRAAITAGIDYEQAYSLNDHYVMTIESLTAYDDVMQMIESILKDMAVRVRNLRNVHLSKNIRRVYQIILDAPERNPSVDELSKRAGLSASYLSTSFKKEVGLSLARFKMLSKINRVIQLISITNLSITEIAVELNFADQAHLSREFKQFVGVSPSVARKHPGHLFQWNMYDFLSINVGWEKKSLNQSSINWLSDFSNISITFQLILFITRVGFEPP